MACSGQCLTALQFAIWFSILLRDPQHPARGYPKLLAAPFFGTPISNNDWYQKVSTWEPHNNPKSKKNGKTQYQNAPTIKTCKKTSSGRVQTSKIDDPYTVLAVFSEAQGSQKGAKMEPEMTPQGTKHHKNWEKRSLEKTSKTQRCKKRVTACIRGGSAKALLGPKITKIPEIF